MSFIRTAVLAGLASVVLPSVTQAAVLFSDNFDTAASAASWTKNVVSTGTAPAIAGYDVNAQQTADFGFNYATLGIPHAPGSTDTLGLRVRANVPFGESTARPAGMTSGLSLSPTAKNFGTNYRVSFSAWANFNGSNNAAGLADTLNSLGGSNNLTFAIGTAGTSGQAALAGTTALGTIDSVAFATSNDGTLNMDYRVYAKSNTPLTPASGAYAAGTSATTTGGAQDNLNSFYANLPTFGPHAAPSEQLAISTAERPTETTNSQGGVTSAGAFGFAWHDVVITKDNNVITWVVDGTTFATVDASALTLGGQNISIGMSDLNATTTAHPQLLFTVFDNLVVTDVPEPASLGLGAVAVGGLLLRRRRSC